jgi:hypothetical protein
MSQASTFDDCRNEVTVRLTLGGEAAARAYIDSLTDPDYRDAGRAHVANFLTSAGGLSQALKFVAEIEDSEEELDARSRLFGYSIAVIRCTMRTNSCKP